MTKLVVKILDMTYISSIIKKLRIERELSQEYVAYKIGISQTAYSKIERNEIRVSSERIIELAEVFNVDEKDFFPNPKSIEIPDNSLQYNNIKNLLESQKEIFDEQKKLLQETIDILKEQIEKKDIEIQSFLKIIGQLKAN